MRPKLFPLILKQAAVAVVAVALATGANAQSPTTSTPSVSPTNSLVYAGTAVTLTEVATGQTPLFYQWRTDGGSGGTRTNIAGATSSNLTINTTGFPSHDYSYTVVVSNSVGASTSAVVVLNVVSASAPVLKSDITPRSAVADVGGAQTFSAVFTGTLPIAYQWQINTGGGMTNIPNATNASLALTNLQTANSGNYEVLATNSVGGPVSSSVAILTVLANSPFPSAVMAANPVGYWRLNETNSTASGTLVAVDAMSNFNGLYGSASADGVPGPTPSIGFPGFESDNTGAQFSNGVANSYVTLPPLNLNTNTVTFTAWIYPVGTPANYCGIVFCRNGTDASGFCFFTGGQLGYTWNQNNGDTFNWQSGLVPPQGQWSFIALVVSPSNAVAYLCNTNGQSSATNAVASTVEAFSGSTLIGDDAYDDNNGSRTFNGRMDEVAVFNYSLTAAQVLDLYASASVGTPIPALPVASPSNTVFAGTAVTWTEVASGQMPFYYQWQTDGGSGGARTNISGATLPSLSVNTTALSPGAYNYDVIVSNSSGAATSGVVVLHLLAASAPELVSDITPSSAVVYVGGAQTFSATFTGTQPIAYQWQANTGGGMTNIPKATNASLTLTNLQAASSGSYRILATNSVGGPVSSSTATLTVLANSPFPSAVLAANPVGFWKLNETNSTSSGTLVAADAMNNFNGTYGSDSLDGVPGPTPSLGFPGFESNNTAAEFTYGEANSYVTLPALNLNANTVTFTAWVYPIGTPANYSGIVFCRNNGDAAGFCFTDGGQIGYTWNDNSENTWDWMSGLVPPPGQWSFIALVVSPSNAVVYLCDTNNQTSATNSVASSAEAFSGTTLIGDDNADGGNGDRTFNGMMDEVAIFNYSLTQIQVLSLYFNAVGGAPRVAALTASPSNTVFADTTVTLNPSVYGLAPFQYQWQSNGVNLAGATNATLVLTNAQVADSGSYDVVVGNSSGTNESSTLVLKVNPPSAPIFTQEPSPASLTNYVNGLATFTAAVAGSPPIALQWELNGTSLAGQTAAFLTLPNLQTNQSGTYTLLASNALGTNVSTPAVLTVLPLPNGATLNFLTYHNDNTRQGANTNEFLLTLSNVNVATFGRLFTYPVDGYVYAAPLYVSGLAVPGQGTLNAVFVATENDSVYAFNADSNAGTNAGLLWSTNLGIAGLSTSGNFGDESAQGYTDLIPEVGITGTPVIDPASGTIYLDAFTHAGTSYYHHIHALNITNGQERPYSPVLVAASVNGTGGGSSGGVIVFPATYHLQRPALTLAGGRLYVAYGSYADINANVYHGWVMTYNATNLAQLTNYTYCTTPNAQQGAIWMSGNGLCVDNNTNLFFETANGPFDTNTPGGLDLSDSFVKLSTTNTLVVADYFTPYNQASLAAGDTDLGSGGSMLLPDAVGSTAHPHLIVGCGKEGTIHLVDRDNMGHYNSANDNQIVQEVPGAVGGTWSSPAYFNNLIFYQGNGDVMKSFYISNAVITATPITRSTTSFGFPGATPVISATGTNNGIAWIIEADAYTSSGPAVLHAYNATNLAQELYNTSMNLARDNPGAAVKMTTPTVINGKVYVGAEYALSVYGNSVFLATPSISPNGGLYTNLVTVTLSDSSPGVSIYYTLDGTAPTTNSLLYTGAFALTNSVGVQAVAVESGATPSGVAQASFVNFSSIGDGTGLTGSYFSNHTSASPFTGAPALVRTDATVNFTWNATGPASSVGPSNYTVRWTGCVQPQFSEDYTFFATADDGVRLWINGQEIINGWVDNGTPTSYQASLPLVAQQLYNVEMDFFYENDGAAEAQLAWSSPSTPKAIIPQTQLYPYTNPPPTVVLSSPTNGSTFTATATVSLIAIAAAPYNPLSYVSFYTNGAFVGSVSNAPYALTGTGLAAGSYILTAVASDTTGLMATSAVVNITVNAGSGSPYGLTNVASAPAFYNMPSVFTGPLPTLLSLTGVFTNTPGMAPAAGLIPYAPNVQLFSDNAQKVRYFSVPNTGAPYVPSEQIAYQPTNTWSFPAGTIFVKTFELQTNLSDPTSLRRLETRLLVRDTNGAVYGVTYKWRSDYSDADLLTTNQTEPILIQTPGGVYTNLWYYPSPSDCLQCHTAVANYVLGVNARQLNGDITYSNGVTDNQLRALNRAGLFYPAIDESQITNVEQLSALTNPAASYVQRARSYLDANCAQCHQPGGTGPTFDARYDTPLASQNIIGTPAVKGNLGYDNVDIVTPEDVWRSSLYDRMDVVNPAVQMPPLARNLIDTNAVEVMAEWINSLPGTPALPPPTLVPAGGTFQGYVQVAIQPPTNNVAIYYTLDGTLPTTNSQLYSNPFLLTNSATVNANAWEAGYSNSVVGAAQFTILPGVFFLSPGGFTNGQFQMAFAGPAGSNYVLQVSTNLTQWSSISTNTPATSPFVLTDTNTPASSARFYRVIQAP